MEELNKVSSEQITPVKQQLTFPLDKTSQDIIRRYSAGEAFPVGSVFISTVSTDPSVLLGYGTWSVFGAGKVLVGQDILDTDFDVLGEEGGEKRHTLIISEIPSHAHDTSPFPMTPQGGTTNSGLGGSNVPNSQTVTGLTGGGGSHNNLQPYVVVTMWKRDS